MEIRPNINVKNRKTREKKVFRIDQDRLTAGRESSNYIVLEGNTISRRHVEFLTEGRQYFVRDLKSNNGTLLNDTKLTPNEKILLRSGDVIQIEDFDLHFHIPLAGEVEDINEVTDTDVLEIKMVKKLLKAMDRASAPSLEALDGPSVGKRFTLEEKNQDVVIGRDPACEFFVDSNVISRKHARIEKRFDTVIIYDLESKNGLFVNRERVTEKRLQDGDVIHLGTMGLTFRNPQELSFDLAPPKKIAKEISVEPIAQTSPTKKEEVYDLLSPGSRSSRKRGESDKSSESVDESSFSQSMRSALLLSENPANPNDSLSPIDLSSEASSLTKSEIIAIVVGALILLGSIWGILKLLK